jgi:hypothetical protein
MRKAVCSFGVRGWALPDEEGERRLDNPEDYVRIEIATALKRKIRVIPVLGTVHRFPSLATFPMSSKHSFAEMHSKSAMLASRMTASG